MNKAREKAVCITLRIETIKAMKHMLELYKQTSDIVYMDTAKRLGAISKALKDELDAL